MKDADHTLDRPHPKFAVVKECYPHFFHGTDKAGNVVYYELPGQCNYNRLKRAGITKDEFVDHVMCVCPHTEAHMRWAAPRVPWLPLNTALSYFFLLRALGFGRCAWCGRVGGTIVGTCRSTSGLNCSRPRRTG